MEGLPHHVILRGNNRRRIFSQAPSYRRFLLYLADALKRSDCQLHALALMSNHIHMIVTPSRVEGLSSCVQRLAQRYAMFRNRTTESSGKLFDQRFHAVAITTEEQLAITCAYVDLNPVRAGLVLDPSRYPWSTAGLHCGMSDWCQITPSLWTPCAWYQALGRDEDVRRKQYRRWIEACRERAEAVDRAERQAIEREAEAADRIVREAKRIAPEQGNIRRPDGRRAC